MTEEHRTTGNGRSATLLTVVVVVAALYLARIVLIPLALAVLLAFLLAPVVIRLRYWRLGRTPATLLVVHLAVAIIAVFGLILASQLSDLGRKMPEYEQNMRQKLESIRVSGGGLINRVTRMVANLTEELTPSSPPAPRTASGEEKPVPVEIRKAPFAPLEMFQKVLGSVLNLVLMAGIVIVFVIFILIQREDLRDRLIRLVGAGRLNATTQALDDAAGRMSRYLLAQLAINTAFGILAGVSLYFIGVPDPVFWGMMAVLLRYIPYLGIWIAAAMPAIVAFAVEPGWVKVPLVFGTYLGIDLLMYNFVEPLLYGTSTGVSPMAILLGTVFWTWLWGPLGLLLATPLTVCLVVIGRYVPSLEFLSVMLSDEPVLTPETRFYQRLLAMDLEEATEIAEQFLKGKSLEDLADGVIIPALSLAEEERHRGKLDEVRQQFIFQNTRLLVEDLAERAGDIIAGNDSSRPRSPDQEKLQTRNLPTPGPPEVVCVPARDEADEIAALMLAQLLIKRGVHARAFSSIALAGECIEEISRGGAKVACVTMVPPYGYLHGRYLCRRLRAQFPELKLVAAVLTERDRDEIKRRQPALAADELGASLKQAMTAILSLLPAANNHCQQGVGS